MVDGRIYWWMKSTGQCGSLATKLPISLAIPCHNEPENLSARPPLHGATCGSGINLAETAISA
jgi:hypothetical protein